MNDKTKKVEKKWTKKRIIKENRSILLIVVLVFAFRSIFFEPFRIPTGSMIPTFMIGDFILVNKYSYGFKLPFSDMFTNPIYLNKAKSPERGDIIVFKYPNNPDINYIKRVVAIPGDNIEMIDRVVYINDLPYKTVKFDGKEIMADMDDKFKQYPLDFFNAETGKHKHVIQQVAGVDQASISNFPKTKIPPKKYFVMGDNRDFSADSRYWGFVPFSHIKGEALLVWFSMIFPKAMSGMSFKLRHHRIGTIVD